MSFILCKRIGSSEITSAILMAIVSTAIIGGALAYTGSHMANTQTTATQQLKQSTQSVGEMLSLTGVSTNSGTLQIEVVNYGTHDLTVTKLMVDGQKMSGYSFQTLDGSILTTIPMHNPTLINIPGAPSSAKGVEIITKDNTLFELLTGK